MTQHQKLEAEEQELVPFPAAVEPFSSISWKLQLFFKKRVIRNCYSF